jgi:HK97 gp10 family phage protein
MSGLQGLRTFQGSLEKFKARMGGNSQKALLIAGVDLAKGMVKNIHSDTGRLKTSIRVGHGKPVDEDPGKLSRSGLKYSDNGQHQGRVADEVMAGDGSQDIFISTNVQYAQYVEYGTDNPKYPAQHFREKAIAQTTNRINKALAQGLRV